jgi:hypothetical protein
MGCQNLIEGVAMLGKRGIIDTKKISKKINKKIKGGKVQIEWEDMEEEPDREKAQIMQGMKNLDF